MKRRDLTERTKLKDLEWFFKPRAGRGPATQAMHKRHLLDTLNSSDRAVFLSKCTRKQYGKRQTLFVAGQRHTATYMVASGLVQTYYQAASGREITIGYRGPGEIVGGPYFFDDSGVHVWCARAAQDSEVLAISGLDLRALVTKVPGIGDAVFDAISSKLVWDSLLIQILGTRAIKERLAHLLVRLALFHGVTHGDHTVIRYFTQEDLANMVGASRQWINIQMKEFKAKNMVDFRNKTIVILDLNKLIEQA